MRQLSLYWHLNQADMAPGSSNLADSTWQHVSQPVDSEQGVADTPSDSADAASTEARIPGADGLPAQTVVAVPVSVSTGRDDSTATSTSNHVQNDSSTDSSAFVLHPMDCDLRVSTKTDKRTGMTVLSTLALMEGVQLQLDKQQICDIVQLIDLLAIWEVRNRYAVLRPTGWRSNAAVAVPPR